jgi:hypothetical protein
VVWGLQWGGLGLFCGERRFFKKNSCHNGFCPLHFALRLPGWGNAVAKG